MPNPFPLEKRMIIVKFWSCAKIYKNPRWILDVVQTNFQKLLTCSTWLIGGESVGNGDKQLQ